MDFRRGLFRSGRKTGTAYATPVGGTPAYTYDWSNGATAQTVSGLAAGQYTVTITDASGKNSTTVVNLIQPNPIQIKTDSTLTSCAAPTGSASVNVTGGTGAYSYSWS